MSVIGFGRVDVKENRYGKKNTAAELTWHLSTKLESRGVDLEGVTFSARNGKKHPEKVIVDAFRGKKWIASANCDHYGNVVYSMPGTDKKR